MSNELGKAGERAVGEYLENKGFRIICFNYHSRFGEIDIISEDEKYTVFVEVKTRKSFKFSRAIEAVNKSKRTKIIKTALCFIGENGLTKQPRFDIAEVLAFKNNEFEIIYHENAFDSEECYAIF